MKQLFLVALCSVATLAGVNSVNAQGAHFNSGPCLSGNTVIGEAAGLGEGAITVTISGQSDCLNPAQNEPPAWQNFSISQNISKGKGGNYNISVSLASLCNKRWTFVTSNLICTIKYADGTKTFWTPVSSSCN
jgi:hypothetical protein